MPLALKPQWESQVYITKHVMPQLQASHTLMAQNATGKVSPERLASPLLLGALSRCRFTLWALSLLHHRESIFAGKVLSVLKTQGSFTSKKTLMWDFMLVKSIQIKTKLLFLLGKGNKKTSEMWKSQLGAHPPCTSQGIVCLLTTRENWYWAQLHSTNEGYWLSDWKHIFMRSYTAG